MFKMIGIYKIIRDIDQFQRFYTEKVMPFLFSCDGLLGVRLKMLQPYSGSRSNRCKGSNAIEGRHFTLYVFLFRACWTRVSRGSDRVVVLGRVWKKTSVVC
jgi:hypothetical protein